ncbi:hypothetical protein [Nostoc sp.]|uniref:hypothetical protein n=1 Tax=Nostoc sp. TaxID=1180 RepID=UPI0035940770
MSTTGYAYAINGDRIGGLLKKLTFTKSFSLNRTVLEYGGQIELIYRRHKREDKSYALMK